MDQTNEKYQYAFASDLDSNTMSDTGTWQERMYGQAARASSEIPAGSKPIYITRGNDGLPLEPDVAIELGLEGPNDVAEFNKWGGARPPSGPIEEVVVTGHQSLDIDKVSPQIQFIAALYNPAREASRRAGLSLNLTLAQAAQETGWGKKVLAGTNNIFNIKATKDWSGSVKEFLVPEYLEGKMINVPAEFRVYPSVSESIMDRADFLLSNRRYSGLFEENVKGNFVKEAYVLQKAGYATDPQYAAKLIKVGSGPTMRKALEFSRKYYGE